MRTTPDTVPRSYERPRCTPIQLSLAGNLEPSTLRSAIAATLAARHGADPSDLWSRLGLAISWTTASVLDGAAGYVTLVKSGNRERTTRELITTALSLAKQASLLIEPNERAELTIDNQRVQKLSVEHGCDDERGESCQFLTLIDGISTPCSTTMDPNRCVLTVPIGRHRIELSFRRQYTFRMGSISKPGPHRYYRKYAHFGINSNPTEPQH